MAAFGEHHSTSAKTPPPNDRPPAPAPPPPPRWRMALIVLGLLITVLLLFRPSIGTGTPNHDYSYLRFTRGYERQGSQRHHRFEREGDGQPQERRRLHVADPNCAARPPARAAALGTPRASDGEGPAGCVPALDPSQPRCRCCSSSACSSGSRGPRCKQLAGGIMGIGASKAKVYDEERPTTRFADVAGYEGAKREISEVVDFLKHPERYAAAGAVDAARRVDGRAARYRQDAWRRAVAGEADVPFFALTGSSFVELFVGVGAARVRDLFAAARKAAAGDHLHRRDRRHRPTPGWAATSRTTSGSRRSTRCSRRWTASIRTAGVVVIAATNRPETLDPALLRPGRFDRQVEIPLPNLRARAAILAVHARGKHLAPRRRPRRGRRARRRASRVPTSRIWSTKPRSSRCVRIGDIITAADFSEARDRILLGRRERDERTHARREARVAVHESGHALVAALSGRRPGGEGDDPARRPGARRDRAAARRRTSPVPRELPQGLARSPARRAGGRAARARRGVVRGRERPGRRDRPRDAHGP